MRIRILFAFVAGSLLGALSAVPVLPVRVVGVGLVGVLVCLGMLVED